MICIQAMHDCMMRLGTWHCRCTCHISTQVVNGAWTHGRMDTWAHGVSYSYLKMMTA